MEDVLHLLQSKRRPHRDKKAHVGVIPGLTEYLREFTSERAWGDEGYLSDRGLIPLPEEERERVANDVRELNPLSLAGN